MIQPSAEKTVKTGEREGAVGTVGYHYMLTLQPMHLKDIFQLVAASTDAATTPVVCTNGLEIPFYPNLTPERAL